MAELLEEWVRYHAGGQYRRYEYAIDRYEQAIEFADSLLKDSAIRIPLSDPVRPDEHVVLAIRTLDLPVIAFLFRVQEVTEAGVRLAWLPRRNSDKPILLAFRGGAQAAVRHGLTGQKPAGPHPNWVADVLYRHARRNRLNPFETLDLHWTAVGDEPEQAFKRLHPKFVGGEAFVSADPVLQAKALVVGKKIQEAYLALDTPEKRSRQRKRWGDLHQLGSATIVLTQKLAAVRRSGDRETEERLLSAKAELEHTESLIAQERQAKAKRDEPIT